MPTAAKQILIAAYPKHYVFCVNIENKLSMACQIPVLSIKVLSVSICANLKCGKSLIESRSEK